MAAPTAAWPAAAPSKPPPAPPPAPPTNAPFSRAVSPAHPEIANATTRRRIPTRLVIRSRPLLRNGPRSQRASRPSRRPSTHAAFRHRPLRSLLIQPPDEGLDFGGIDRFHHESRHLEPLRQPLDAFVFLSGHHDNRNRRDVGAKDARNIPPGHANAQDLR